MRDTWTDERMDDLSQRVDRGFSETSREFQAVRLEMRTEFGALRSEMREEFGALRSEIGGEFGALRSEIGGEFGAVRTETNSMNRTLLQVVLGGYAVMFAGFAGTIATIITQT